jgi:hypothetical protein
VLALIESDRIACGILGPSGLCCASFAPARLALDAERENRRVCGIGQLIADRIDHSQPAPAADRQRAAVVWLVSVSDIGCPFGVGHRVSDQ